MSYLARFISSFQSTERISQGAVSSEFQQPRYVFSSSSCSCQRVIKHGPTGNSPHTISIHILDDDSLLNIFHLYRPFLLGEEDQDVNFRSEGGGKWVGERWWYRLTHVCQRWRNLILGSASYLDLCLVCTYGTPVADMLAHSPPLPLVIDYHDHDITAEDEEEIILALEQRDRVHRIRFDIPVLKLQKLIMAIDGEYPNLKYLILRDPPEDKSSVLILPETLQTPHLRHLAIGCFIRIPIQSPLLGTVAGLVVLHLAMDHPSTYSYFRPTVLLQWLSLMPQLEILQIFFNFAVPNRDVERQLMRTPIMTHVTLPNLRTFTFQAVSAYSEAVLSRITASRLEHFQIYYLKQLTFSVPQLLQFMGRTENFRFDRVWFHFYSERVYVEVNSPENNMPVDPFSLSVDCWHLDWQVSSVAQIFNALSQIFSAVEHLTLAHKAHSRSSEEHNEVDRTEWRKLLRSFSNVKTLRIEDGLVQELSRCLPSEDGEHPLELLPELQELKYLESGNANAFTSFIDARQNAGRPVSLIAIPPMLQWMLLPFDTRRSTGKLQFDFAREVDEIILTEAIRGSRPLSVLERNKPATEPRLTEMVIHCAELPDWPVHVARHSGIRCVDIFGAIRDTYNVVLTATERSIHQSRVRDIERRRPPTPEGAKKGVRRRDLLDGTTLFLGLDWRRSDARYPNGCWCLKVGYSPT
jgi:hypothetical protein